MAEKDYCIEMYLRTYVYQKILKFLEKKKCKICGSTYSLILHHSEELMFTDIISKSLYDLKIDYKENYKDYSEDELRKIKIMVLGYHFYNHFYILCEQCHIDIHKGISTSKSIISYKFLNKRYGWQIEYYKDKFPESTIDDFFNNFNKLYLEELMIKYSGQKMFKKEINNFKLIISKDLIKNQLTKEPDSKMIRAFDGRSTGLRSINRIFQTYRLNYRLESHKQRSRKIVDINNLEKKYWIVLPIEDTNNEQ